MDDGRTHSTIGHGRPRPGRPRSVKHDCARARAAPRQTRPDSWTVWFGWRAIKSIPQLLPPSPRLEPLEEVAPSTSNQVHPRPASILPRTPACCGSKGNWYKMCHLKKNKYVNGRIIAMHHEAFTDHSVFQHNISPRAPHTHGLIYSFDSVPKSVCPTNNHPELCRAH